MTTFKDLEIASMFIYHGQLYTKLDQAFAELFGTGLVYFIQSDAIVTSSEPRLFQEDNNGT